MQNDGFEIDLRRLDGAAFGTEVKVISCVEVYRDVEVRYVYIRWASVNLPPERLRNQIGLSRDTVDNGFNLACRSSVSDLISGLEAARGCVDAKVLKDDRKSDGNVELDRPGNPETCAFDFRLGPTADLLGSVVALERYNDKWEGRVLRAVRLLPGRGSASPVGADRVVPGLVACR